MSCFTSTKTSNSVLWFVSVTVSDRFFHLLHRLSKCWLKAMIAAQMFLTRRSIKGHREVSGFVGSQRHEFRERACLHVVNHQVNFSPWCRRLRSCCRALTEERPVALGELWSAVTYVTDSRHGCRSSEGPWTIKRWESGSCCCAICLSTECHCSASRVCWKHPRPLMTFLLTRCFPFLKIIWTFGCFSMLLRTSMSSAQVLWRNRKSSAAALCKLTLTPSSGNQVSAQKIIYKIFPGTFVLRHTQPVKRQDSETTRPTARTLCCADVQCVQ